MGNKAIIQNKKLSVLGKILKPDVLQTSDAVTQAKEVLKKTKTMEHIIDKKIPIKLKDTHATYIMVSEKELKKYGKEELIKKYENRKR